MGEKGISEGGCKWGYQKGGVNGGKRYQKEGVNGGEGISEGGGV